MKVEGLEARFFGGVSHPNESDPSAPSGSASGGERTEHSEDSDSGKVMETTVGEGMMFKEDNFLTSANLCRWVIGTEHTLAFLPI